MGLLATLLAHTRERRRPRAGLQSQISRIPYRLYGQRAIVLKKLRVRSVGGDGARTGAHGLGLERVAIDHAHVPLAPLGTRRDPKIDQVHGMRIAGHVEHDVGGLDIIMYYARMMQLAQAAQGGTAHAQHHLSRQPRRPKCLTGPRLRLPPVLQRRPKPIDHEHLIRTRVRTGDVIAVVAAHLMVVVELREPGNPAHHAKHTRFAFELARKLHGHEPPIVLALAEENDAKVALTEPTGDLDAPICQDAQVGRAQIDARRSCCCGLAFGLHLSQGIQQRCLLLGALRDQCCAVIRWYEMMSCR